MLRSTLNLAGVFFIGCAASIAVLMLGFFASPEAVRTSPPASYSSLLMDQLVRR